jgi:hypothetical protein
MADTRGTEVGLIGDVIMRSGQKSRYLLGQESGVSRDTLSSLPVLDLENC